MPAHFGDMLLERRRARGLSIQQVANVIKIRPQIIEYFETENFDAMPSRGYAQGMISSYARFLGLNPRTVVDAYFDELAVYERSGGVSRRSQDAGMAASPRSANASRRFMMVEGTAPAASRFAARPPQAGYVSESSSLHEPVSASRLRPASDDARRARRPRSQQDRPDRASSRRRSEGARSRTARDGRRPTQREARRSQGGRTSRRAAAPFDPRLLIAAAIAALAVVALIAFLVMRGCSAPTSKADEGGSAPKTQAVGADGGASSGSDASDDGSDDSGDSGDDTADASDDQDSQDAKDGADAATQEPEQTKVTVSIPKKGVVAWIEVKLDGVSVLGSDKVGPFEQEYTVNQQIDITTNMPSDVEVTKNGKKVRYDTKVSGVAKVSIIVPQNDDAAAQSGDVDGSDADAGDSATDDQAATDMQN